MEVDVDQIAQRFDSYPELRRRHGRAVDYLMLQTPEKVRAFLIKYQDRVVYGTDNSGSRPTTRPRTVLKEWAARYERDWKYFSGEDVQFEEGTTKGLHLPGRSCASCITTTR